MVRHFELTAEADGFYTKNTRSELRSGGWVLAFVFFQIACQLLLLFEIFGPLRVLVRSAAFGASLMLLFSLPGQGQPHPSYKPALWVLFIVSLSIIHPTTNSFTSGVAQIMMYLAILGPLFWVPRLKIDLAMVRRVMLILFLFHTSSAAVGILQMYYPGRFQPNLSSAIAEQGDGYVGSLYITLASGDRVFRPMGLTDLPGGAASAGFYAAILGMVFFIGSRGVWPRAACLGSIMLGMSCIYLSQVRSLLVLTLICMLVFLITLIWRREMRISTLFTAMLIIVVGASFHFSVWLGGESVTSRLETLIEDSPTSVYYRNRGIFLEKTIDELLPQYPLGVGLGRWGMANTYFGDNSNPETASIYAEIQWTGWLLDGGIPLVLAYVATLFLALQTAWKIASRHHRFDNLWLWGAFLLAYNIGALAITFNYPLFIGQRGLELWLLNALVFAAAETQHQGLSTSGSYQKWAPSY